MSKNVTVSLPDDIISSARHLAVDKGLSLSGLVAQVIMDLTKQGDAYSAAQQEALEILNSGFNMGSEGHLGGEREQLHER